ncbi:MAG: MFS transporter [Aeromicrobium sp.]|uniref:MFS transporter n=1 Tax=Aeromicrobium sp. TaxID=1871063 RepID=UPI0039E42ED2
MTVGPQRWAYPALMGIIMLGLGISGAPSPLYGMYAEEWGYRPITTTVVFAAYAAAALIAVLASGSISDRYGRRPLLIAATSGLVLGLVVFMVASAAWMLIVARVIHGLSVGTVVVVSSAALLDLRPDEGAATGRRTGIAFNIGISVVIVLTSVHAEYGPAPLVVPYAVLAVLSAIALAAVLAMRETHTEDRAVTLHVARPQVPADIAADFRFAAIGVMASWSVLGVLLSLYPTLASVAVGADNLVFGGFIVGGSAAAAAVSQQVAARWPARPAAIAGDLGTAVSLGLCVLAIHVGDAIWVSAASLILGFFFGFAFGSSLRHLGQVIPAAHRGEVMSAFYVLAYGSMAVPTILAGAAATVWGVEAIFAPFMACVAAASLLAAFLGSRVAHEPETPSA